MGPKTFRERLREKYKRIKGYIASEYHAPEMVPDIQSGQVKALAEMMEELEARVELLEATDRLRLP